MKKVLAEAFPGLMNRWVTHVKLFVLKRLYNPNVVLSTETTELGSNRLRLQQSPIFASVIVPLKGLFLSYLYAYHNLYKLVFCIFDDIFKLIKMINLIKEVFMDILNASDAKREFGELLLKAQHAPVGINKNGKPVAVVVSANEYRELKSIKEEKLKLFLQEGLDDLNSGKVSDGKDVISRLRKRIV